MVEGPEVRRLRLTWLGTMAYREAWSLQRRLAQALRRGELEDDCVLLLEHQPVYTMGRTGSVAHLRRSIAELRARGADYVEVDRGGSVTFHGPGQLVAYPIVRVPDIFPLENGAGSGDVIRYIRALERATLTVVSELGVPARTRAPLTGVWVDGAPPRKIAAIGVKVAGGVSTHGLALNLSTELGWFEHIVPCGIAGAGVTSLRQEGVGARSLQDLGMAVGAALARELHRRPVGPGRALTALLDSQTGFPGLAAAV